MVAVWARIASGVKWFHKTGSTRTACQVRWAVSIYMVAELGGGCSHLQVDHLPGVFQGRNSIFMENILQRHVVHLQGSEVIRSLVTRHYSQKTWWFSYSNDFIPDLEPSVTVRRSSLDNLCDVDAVVSRNMLVPDTTSDAEAETWTTESGEPSYKYWNCSGCLAGTHRRSICPRTS